LETNKRGRIVIDKLMVANKFIVNKVIGNEIFIKENGKDGWQQIIKLK
jgi:hypothetical protein